MSKVEFLVCDICKGEDEVKGDNIMVVFTTETTEGRSTDPYLALEHIDICNNCRQYMIKNRTLLTATGAQGYNNYLFFHPTTQTPTKTRRGTIK